MDPSSWYDQIEAYLAGTLPLPERELLEQRLAADPALAAELALHRRLQRELSDGAKIDFRQKLEAVAADLPVPKAGRRWLLGLAALLLLVVAVWWWSSRPPAPQEVAPVPAPGRPDSINPPQQPLATFPQTSTPPNSPTPAPPKPSQLSNPAFTAHPGLERQTASELDPYFAVKDAVLARDTSTRAFVFQARLLTALELPTLALNLLDHTGRPALTLPVSATPEEEDKKIYAFGAKKAYRLLAGAAWDLPPGLYYGRLAVVDGDKAIWVGRLRVE
jgi:hypothetical protein